MKWLAHLLNRSTPADSRAEERKVDHEALQDLRDSFGKVHRRTDRLEAELRRVNTELRVAHAKRGTKR